MFKKPKKLKGAAALRRKDNDDSDDDNNRAAGGFRHRQWSNSSSSEEDNAGNSEEGTSALLAQLKAARRGGPKNKLSAESKSEEETKKKRKVGHEFASDANVAMSAQEMATRTAEYHPREISRIQDGGSVPENADADAVSVDVDSNIYRGQKQQQNKFLAGPLRAPTFVRTTCRFDYQPDICKDYKETGFCGFGDTCIYLHDRGDTLSGWQLERQWEEKRKKELEQKERELNRFLDGETSAVGGEVDEELEALKQDGIPFACYICRGPFINPVATTCGHYFCSKCIMGSFARTPCCPVCNADTGGVFNHPTKLYAKKRRVVGNDKSWDEYADVLKSKSKALDICEII